MPAKGALSVSSSWSMFHVNPSQKDSTASDGSVQVFLAFQQWPVILGIYKYKFVIATWISNLQDTPAIYIQFWYMIEVSSTCFFFDSCNRLFSWSMNNWGPDSITRGSLRKLPLSNVGHGQTTMFSCTTALEKRVFERECPSASCSRKTPKAIHKSPPPPPPPPEWQ